MSLFSFISAASGIRQGVSVITSPTPNQVGDVVLTVDGNSLTEGTGSSIVQYYPKRVRDFFRTSFASLTFNSFGVGGQKLDQMIADAATQIDPLVDISKLNILVFWETVNQIYSIGSGADHFTRTQNYAQGRKNAGYDLIILVTPPYLKKDADGVFRGIAGVVTPNDVGGYHDRLTDFVTLVEGADINAMPWDIHINLMNAPHIGGGRDEVKDNDFFVDSTHYAPSGYAVVDNMVSREIKNGLNIAPSVYSPTNVTASNVTGSGLTLSWGAPQSAYTIAEYRIYKNNRLIAISNTLSKALTLVQGTPYNFTVGAVDTNGNEHFSDILFVRTPGTSRTTPVNLRVDTITSSGFRVYWDAAVGGGTITLQTSKDYDFATLVTDNAGLGGNNITMGGGFESATKYYVRVKQSNGVDVDSDFTITTVTTL